MRLCRRKSLLPALCPGRCPRAPYEEVVRHQRHPSDTHRLIVLVGTSPLSHPGRQPLLLSEVPLCSVALLGAVGKHNSLV